MNDWKLGAVETRFAELIWANEPLPSGALVKLCEKELNWKKPTTYTVLRKLCEKGLFENVDGTVRVKITREQFYAQMSEQVLEEGFSGSLPSFIAAFTARKPLSGDEADEILKMIEAFQKGDKA